MIRPLVLMAAAALGASAAAQPSSGVSSAIAAGQVGERYDGYLGFPGAVSPRVRSEVGSVNIERRTLYTRLGVQRRVSRQDVGIAAGCQLLARVAFGQFYLLGDGVWRRRAANQPPPVPDYCR